MPLSPSTIIITYLFTFLFGSMLGYGLEVLFRRFATAKKWVNPGFLKGPWLPLYGFGIVTMFSLTMLFTAVLPKSMPLYNPMGDLYGQAVVSGPTGYDLIVIAALWASLVLLEFLAGLLFVKGFHIRLWDYTNMRGNIMGIICPAFNAIWLLAAVGYYYLLSPAVYELVLQSSEYMFGSNDGSKAAHFMVILVLGVGLGIFLVDLVQELRLFPSLIKFAKEAGIIDQYEKYREENRRRSVLAKQKIYDSLPTPIKESIERSKKTEKKPNRFGTWLKRLIFIDPDKVKDAANNYDENGRPIAENDEESPRSTS